MRDRLAYWEIIIRLVVAISNLTTAPKDVSETYIAVPEVFIVDWLTLLK